MMFWMQLVLTVLGVWWLCGVVNVALMQAFSSTAHVDFNDNYRGATLSLCYGLGPIATLVCLVWGLIKMPLKLGTRWGRALGRLINPNNG
jgi:hypothetical protein